MDLPPTMAMEASMTRQNIALSVIKSSADQDKLVANILERSVEAAASGRGGNLNLFA